MGVVATPCQWACSELRSGNAQTSGRNVWVRKNALALIVRMCL